MEKVNLLPDIVIEKRLRRRKGMQWLLAGLSAVILLAVYSSFIGNKLADMKRRLVPLEEQVAEKQRLAAKVGDLEKELQRAVEKQATVKDLLDQPEWPNVLVGLAEAAENDAWLERLKITKVTLERDRDEEKDSRNRQKKEQKEEIVETRFSAEGYAFSNFELANFMSKVKKNSYFDNVELDYSKLTENDMGEPVIEFKIEGKFL